MEEELQYIVSTDANGNPLEGSKNYKIHLYANIPDSNFWSLIVYDYHTRLMIITDQPWPSVYSSSKELQVNKDGSVNVFFGNKIPFAKANNWVKTIPGKNWYMILRFYGLKHKNYDKNWKPEVIEDLSSQ